MTRLFLLLYLLMISFFAFNQRIGVDVSTRLENFNATLTYHQIIRSHFLVSAGIFMGGNGNAFAEIDTSAFDAGNRIRSPFPIINTYYDDSIGNYGLLGYQTVGSSRGFHLSFGYFKQFNTLHSIRFHLNSRWGMAQNTVRAYYRATELLRTQKIITEQYHGIGSLGLEAFHGIRMGTRISLYYGLKLPYFFTLNKTKFAPVRPGDLFFKVKPELSFGLTYYVGKLNSK